jgi:tripeptide aminopeptidase
MSAVATLNALPEVRRALALLNDVSAPVQTALAIQQIAAPTFAEMPRAQAVARRFSDLGLSDVTVDELGNVYARRAGSADAALPAIVVTAHLDTVFPPETDLTVRHEGNRIYGPGLGDNSTGVAGLLHLAAVLQQQQLPHQRDIWFAANVGEEGLGDLRGMRAVVDRLAEQTAAVVVLEGCDFGTIHHQAIGVRRYRVRTQAAGGHSWGNYGNPSAIHALARLAARLADLTVPSQPRTTLNIGTISGGTSVNTIAQSAELLLDMRSVSLQTLQQLAARVDALIAATAAEQVGVQFTTTVVGDRPAGSLPREHALVQATAAAFTAVGAQLTFQQSSTDANIPLSRHLPAVCIGLTDGGNAHRTDEYIEPANLGRGLQALLLLVLQLAGYADRVAPLHLPVND